MKKSSEDQNRINDKTRLLLNFNYASSVLCLVLFFVCLYLLDIKRVIPHIFLGYAIANTLNTTAFKKHGNLTTMAITTSLLSFISTLIITLFSGGINSPFIFVLSIIVLAGYVSTSVFGRIYLQVILSVIIAIYLLSLFEVPFFTNEVPTQSRDFFSFLSLLFSVYLLGGVFGKNLLKAHHKLYKSKTEIEQRIAEKETLLKEVHHRVKNNLQTVSSLLRLQSKNTTSDEIRDLIKSSQNRVVSMAMIHEMLYMHDDISQIEFKLYVQELTQYLIRSIKGVNSNITLNLTIPDIKLGIDTAIPLGLLINEAVTNSLKYGFVDNNNCEIAITLQKKDIDNQYTLTIEDNGVGYSENLDPEKTKSLGLKLIHNLARQLRGSVKRDISKGGTNYIVDFQDIDKHLKSVA